jgi:hypothetical protein
MSGAAAAITALKLLISRYLSDLGSSRHGVAAS